MIEIDPKDWMRALHSADLAVRMCADVHGLSCKATKEAMDVLSMVRRIMRRVAIDGTVSITGPTLKLSDLSGEYEQCLDCGLGPNSAKTLGHRDDCLAKTLKP